MRILEIVYSLGSGGAERLVVDLCNELAKTQDVTLLILKDVEQFYLPQVSSKVHIIQTRWQVGFKVRYLFDAIKEIYRINPEIVHFHSQARYSLILANLLLHNQYKFFMTIHSDVEKSYAKGVSGLQVRLCGLLGKCKFITISQTNWEQFNRIHPKLKQRLIENGRAKPQCSAELDNVKKDINAFKKKEDTLVFVHVARCFPVKNQKMLIDCFNDLHREGLDFTLLIIGDNFNSPEGQKIQETACPEIHFLGKKENVYDYLTSADAFCLSSIREGMPMSIIEAILSGVPVISTPTCGAVDVIQSGENGILAQGFEKEDFKQAILSYIQNKKHLSIVAKAQRVNSPLSIATCADKYLKWFLS